MPLLGTFEPDNLIAGNKQIETSDVLVASGQNLVRGSVIGRVTPTTPTTGTADGGNTGNGLVTLVEGRRDLKSGSYEIECLTAIANGGVFKVTDPDGNIVKDDITIPVGAGNAIAFETAQLAGTITDGTTDFAVGDKFTVAVTIVERQVAEYDKGASNGTEVPYAIMLEDVDASAAAKQGASAIAGSFVENALVFKAGSSIEDARTELRGLGIFTQGSIRA